MAIVVSGVLASRRLCWVAVLLHFAVLSISSFLSALSQNTNFAFPNFNSTDELTLLHDAVLDSDAGCIALNALGSSTQLQSPTCGRLVSVTRVQLRDSSNTTGPVKWASFSTSFTFAMNGQIFFFDSTGFRHLDGFAFMFARDNVSEGSPGDTMCIIDGQNVGTLLADHRLFAVEFDTYQNTELNDSSNNHVGVNVNSMNSTDYYNFCGDPVVNCSYFVNSGDFTAWIDYDSATVEVRVAKGGSVSKPKDAQIQVQVDLSEVLDPGNDYMYVGFSGSTASYSTLATQIKSWTFASSGMPPAPSPSPNSQSPTASPSPNSQNSKPSSSPNCQNPEPATSNAALLAAVSTMSVVFVLEGLGFCLFTYISGRRKKKLQTELELHKRYFLGPRQFTYKELSIATRNFSEAELLGSGGFGEVYKGSLPDTGSVAVKRITHKSNQGEREFLAEISVISQIRHRNLVQLQGWCREKDKLLLVYEYLPNGSLDRWLFQKVGQKKPWVLAWHIRHNIVTGVAAALAYLHEEWQQCVVHRDIKASNVMLDKDFHAHLGDFGLARLIDHDTIPRTTTVAGTLGYVAPEIAHTGKATKKSDVYSFGVLALEVACGRHVLDPTLSDAEILLVDCVWRAYQSGTLLAVADSRPQSLFDEAQMSCVLQLGLLCCHPDPDLRPTIRLAHQCLIGEASLPSLPASKPVVKYASNHVGQANSSDSVLLDSSRVSSSFATLAAQESRILSFVGSVDSLAL